MNDIDPHAFLFLFVCFFLFFFLFVCFLRVCVLFSFSLLVSGDGRGKERSKLSVRSFPVAR